MSEKLAIQLTDVQKTLLMPLWGRAIETQKVKPLLNDQAAVEIIKNIDYDFTQIEKNLSVITQRGFIIRSLLIDRIIWQFIEKHSDATIVNIGCGLDTTFERNDNGKLLWYDLDLPDVIDLKKQFIPESDRRKYIAASFSDDGWITELKNKSNLLFLSAGVLYYFDESQIKDFLNKISDQFPDSDIVFDASSPIGVKMANKMVIEKNGMDESSLLKWSLKKAEDIKLLNNKLTVIDEQVLFKHRKQGMSLNEKMAATVSDLLRMQYLVHLKVS